ncbi:hypothetical protein FQN60_003062 [Etheostoma spectabile]|uniref:Tyrosine specific protein phosphatases domain-containing protein n=1 Tax=Etheostoma spectabile TaxID=54343 RepID=A0A5J5CNJ7_9PERO|nr:hypothetical protein FQN60_003062 [Etheostoma spectabile]
MSPEEEPEYQTPPTCDLLSLLLRNRHPTGAVNEVWPNLFFGDVLDHCVRGISRSATLALAFLMIRERLTLVEAVEAVSRHRNIPPNVGILNQLCHLDSSLALQRKTTQHQGVDK